MRRLLAAALLSAAVAAGAPAQASALPPVRHVFVIVLENESYAGSFGPDTRAPYLARRLPALGAQLANYYAIGHLSLDNYIAMVSGQAPNPATQADCLVYSDFTPGTPAPDGQLAGQGCVYPARVKTVADQLESKGRRWRGYMEDMASGPPGTTRSSTSTRSSTAARARATTWT